MRRDRQNRLARVWQQWPRVVPLIVSATILCAGVTSQADSGPVPPCGSTTFPPYPAVDKAPTVEAWDPSTLGRNWIPPACTGWTTPGFTTLVVTAAVFRHGSGVEGLLRRFAAVSEFAGMRYWSTTHKRWQTLIIDAHALPGPAGGRRAKDFSPNEIAEGKALYYQMEDNLSGKAIYRMQVLSVSPDRLVLETENISTMRFLLWPIYRAGEMQSIYYFERESEDVWRYYSLMRTGRSASSLTAGNDASSINRAVAFYRYLTGIPTDLEPPASR
jgi:hypothetical protein